MGAMVSRHEREPSVSDTHPEQPSRVISKAADFQIDCCQLHSQLHSISNKGPGGILSPPARPRGAVRAPSRASARSRAGVLRDDSQSRARTWVSASISRIWTSDP
eukprot:7378544-Prymnesium_polylepis.1